MMSVNDVLESFRYYVQVNYADLNDGDDDVTDGKLKLCLKPDPEYRRFKASVNLRVAARLYYNVQSEELPSRTEVEKACSALQSKLSALNNDEEVRITGHLGAAVRNFVRDLRDRMNKSGEGCLRLNQLVSQHVSKLR